MAEEVEPIILILRSLNQSVQLSPEAAARVWDAVKRGEASSPKGVHLATSRSGVGGA